MALTRNRLLLAKIEANYGEDSEPDGDDALLVSNLEVQPLQVELLDRELITPYLGNSTKVVSRRMVTISFDVEIAGSGSPGVPPRYDCLLRSCGFDPTVVEDDPEATPSPIAGSVTYELVSEDFESSTLDFYADDVRHLVTGCRGTVTINLTANEIPRYSFELMGIYNDVTDDPRPVPINFGAQDDPLVVNSDNTVDVEVHGHEVCMETFSLALTNENPFRQLAGCTKEVRITDRAPAGEITIESPSLDDMDYFEAVSDQDLGNVTWQHGSTPGNIVTFTAPTCNLDSPTYADSDGVQMLTLPFMPIPTSAGNDELTIVYT